MIRNRLLRSLILITDSSGGVAPLGVKLSAADFAILRGELVDGEVHVVFLWGIPVIPDHDLPDGTACFCLRGDAYDHRSY